MWNKTDPIMDEHGAVIRGGMFHHQRQWWESKKYIKALITGYGGGKTAISAKRSTSVALMNNGIPYMYVSPSYKVAKRTIIPHFKALWDGRGIAYKENKSDHEFRLSYHGRSGLIWIGSGDDPDALKGPNLCGANIDEPFIQKEGVFKQILARVRDPKAVFREITLTGTPEELNWGYDICEGDDKDKHDIDVIHASTLDNLTLPQQYVDSLMSGYDENTVKAYVKGQFVILGAGIIYRDYSDENHTDKVFNPSGDILWCHDFNFLPMSSAIFQREGDKLNCVDEILLDHADAADTAKEFIERYRGHESCRIILYGDPSGKAGEIHGKISMYLEIEKRLREAGFHRVERRVLASERSIRDSQNSLKGRIRNAKGERNLFVNPQKAPGTNRGLKTAQNKKGSTVLEDDKNRYQHVTTAIRYMTEYEFPPLGRPTLRVR